MADNQTAQRSQQAQAGALPSQRAQGTHATAPRYSFKDLMPALDAVQRVVCLGLAVWVMLHSNNVWEFIVILAASHLDPRSAKDILICVFKGLVSEGK